MTKSLLPLVAVCTATLFVGRTSLFVMPLGWPLRRWSILTMTCYIVTSWTTR
ncbi:hypothetical protein KSP40_PGU007554 [Platanthera guangdongensis]|uniref:Uncharacterized protein n=1 Tax=Platanthera guangdongensis TaxID=2320717 RepID=A0ABR2MU28_9ASPA